jgi:hypothetical protein
MTMNIESAERQIANYFGDEWRDALEMDADQAYIETIEWAEKEGMETPDRWTFGQAYYIYVAAITPTEH